MEAFNFDGPNNVITTKIPSVKSINKMFCKQKGAAGLWISIENLNSSGWEKNCNENCDNDCEEHYIGTSKHYLQTSDDEIAGRGIINPRICVIRRSNLLRLSNDKGQFCGLWKKGDGILKDEKGLKKYICARRFLLIFLDTNNKPLHNDPIQLTAKGVFQVEFDKSLTTFRTEFQTAYAKALKKKSGVMKEEWYAMCVFVPVFESKTVGKAPLQSNACVVSSYTTPTELNWESLCVGRDITVNSLIIEIFQNSEKWISKYNNTPNSSPQKNNLDDEILSTYESEYLN